MEENCTLTIDAELVNRLGSSLVAGFDGIGPADRALLREHIHNALMVEWRRQQSTPDLMAELVGLDELEALANSSSED